MVCGISAPSEEESIYCDPRGGTVVWRKFLHNFHRVKRFSSHNSIGITIDNFYFSVFFPVYVTGNITQALTSAREESKRFVK